MAQAKKRHLHAVEKPKLLDIKDLTQRQQELLNELGAKKLVQMYRDMFLIRSFERYAEHMYQQQKIRGFLHVYMGQEAVGVGMLSALRKDDYVTASYRDHGISLALGLDPGACMAELFGKATGVSGGRGGSMHYYSKDKNLFGGHGIVGGQIPVGLGAGFATYYEGSDKVSLVLMGDGAVQQGSFHECCNMAGLWQLPVLFVIEDNMYGMGTSVDRASAVSDFTLKGEGYAMESFHVDGMNLLDCYATISDAVAVRRKKPSPLLVVAKTYRYRGHSISDPAGYRSKLEVEHYRQMDPIQQIKGLLLKLNWLTDDTVKQLEHDVRNQIQEAIKFAEESPEPELSDLGKHVFAEEI